MRRVMMSVTMGNGMSRGVRKTIGESVMDGMVRELDVGEPRSYGVRTVSGGVELEAYFEDSPSGRALDALRERFEVRETGVQYDDLADDSVCEWYVIVRTDSVPVTGDSLGSQVASFIELVTGNTTRFDTERSNGDMVIVETRPGLTGDELDAVCDRLEVVDTSIRNVNDTAWFGLEIDTVESDL